jgi:predicted ATP-dependent endonuclease of OLD family
MDKTLEAKYEKFFNNFLNKSKDFLAMTDLRVVSDLESKGIITNHSKVVYGDNDLALPEHLNGLGYMNILYLLLQLEITKENFINRTRDINLLFIEEPEAHTHPQLQAIFIEKIRSLLGDIDSLQTFITTHSSHIVRNCKFEDVRCFINDDKNCNVNIKNFYTDLKEKYGDEQDNFNFLNQYLSIESAELFFAEKVIFIEGYSERVLLPYFIKQFDADRDENQKNISSQNISIIEVGANAKAFKHFIDFLEIKTLIITDIDTIKAVQGEKRINYHACPVIEGTHTSNATIRYYLSSPEFDKKAEWKQWFDNLLQNKLDVANDKIKVAYQLEENNYHGRSFEEAFININNASLISSLDTMYGIDSETKEILNSIKTIDEKTRGIILKKSDFASSLLWNSLTKNVVWQMPLYIRKGLEWIAE